MRRELPDPKGLGLAAKAREYFGIEIEAARSIGVLTIDADLTDDQFETLRAEIFTNPVTEISSYEPLARDFDFLLWVGLRPGVRDNL